MNSFERVYSAAAYCGSVVALHTDIGVFTVDDTVVTYGSQVLGQIYGSVLMSDADRRRLQGRRGLSSSVEDESVATATIGVDLDAADFDECELSWFNETLRIAKPVSPTPPFSFVRVVDTPCDVVGQDGTIVAGMECSSGGGFHPTKPGYVESGGVKYLRHVAYVLGTENETITVEIFPNHPYQKHVTVDKPGELNKTTYQIFNHGGSTPEGHRNPSKLYCQSETAKEDESGYSLRAEDSELAYLGGARRRPARQGVLRPPAPGDADRSGA